MHIFLTNDDGYEAPGIVAMAKKLVAARARDGDRAG